MAGPCPRPAAGEETATVTFRTAGDVSVVAPLHIAVLFETVRNAVEESVEEPAEADISFSVPSIQAPTLRLMLALLAREPQAEQRIDEVVGVCPLLAAANFLHAPAVLDFLLLRVSRHLSTLLKSDVGLSEARARYSVPDDLTAAARQEAVAESPLTPEGPPPSPSEGCCALAAAGEDLLEEVLANCDAKPVLLRAKLLSKGWRRTARRIMCRRAWHAKHLKLSELLEHGAGAAAVLERLGAHPEEAVRREPATGWLPIHLAAHLVGGQAELVDVVRALVDVHAPGVRLRDVEGLTPMHVAATAGAPLAAFELLHAAYPVGVQQKVWKVVLMPRGGTAPWHDPSLTTIGQLPLHAALGGACPNAVIVDFLLAAYPEGVQVADACGRLPLHHAAKHAPEALVRRVLEAHPAAAAAEDRDGRLPLAIALEHRPQHGGLVRLLVDAHPEGGAAVLATFVRSLGLAQQLPQIVAAHAGGGGTGSGSGGSVGGGSGSSPYKPPAFCGASIGVSSTAPPDRLVIGSPPPPPHQGAFMDVNVQDGTNWVHPN